MANPIEANNMALESLWKCATFSSKKLFSNFEWFKSNLENGPSPTEFVFSNWFFNRVPECNKWYGVGKLEEMQNFLLCIVSPNSLLFKFYFENGWKRIFTVISTNFIGIGQIIYHWKATENAKLFHADDFLWFLAIFK